jgi:hypothetical protein
MICGGMRGKRKIEPLARFCVIFGLDKKPVFL